MQEHNHSINELTSRVLAAMLCVVALHVIFMGEGVISFELNLPEMN